jgi:hypothetical protein
MKEHVLYSKVTRKSGKQKGKKFLFRHGAKNSKVKEINFKNFIRKNRILNEN